MATRSKQIEDEDEDVVRDEESDDEEQNGQAGASLSIQVDGDMLVIELPRDGNEADTLQRLAKFADGL
jgi:hypothetical protein